MTPEEAIKYLGLIYDDRKEDGVIDNFPGQKAIKLGIEALKFRQDWEKQVKEFDFILLPGETKE